MACLPPLREAKVRLHLLSTLGLALFLDLFPMVSPASSSDVITVLLLYLKF
jgi:hypothetical protein